MHNWMYDECKHCGVDYAAEQQAGMYDDQHLKFRDYEKEFAQMMAETDPHPDDTDLKAAEDFAASVLAGL